MKFKEVIGIDVSKLTLDLRMHKSEKEIELDNELNGFKAMIAWVDKHSNFSLSETVFVFEHTGLYSDQLANFLDDHSIPFYIASGLEIKKSLGITRGKIDKLCAKRIAKYGYRIRDEIKCSKVAPMHYKQLKSLMGLRNRLVKQKAGYEVSLNEQMRVYKQNDYKVLFKVQKKMIKTLKEEIKKIENEIGQLIRQNTETKLMFDLICSIKGVGPKTAIAMIVYTSGFTKFETWRQFASYCGIAPFPHRSGTSIRGKTKVSQFANKQVKKLLHLCAMSAISYNPEIKQYYDRRLNIGKNKMSSLNIVRNKILSRIFAVVKRSTPYVNTKAYAC